MQKSMLDSSVTLSYWTIFINAICLKVSLPLSSEITKESGVDSVMLEQPKSMLFSTKLNGFSIPGPGTCWYNSCPKFLTRLLPMIDLI